MSLLEPTLDVARLVQQVELLKHTNAELRHANTLLLAGGHALEAQHEGLIEGRTTAELNIREARQESSLLQRQLFQARQELEKKKHEISQLQTRLEQVSKTANEQEQLAVQQARNESKQEISRLQQEHALLVQEKSDMANVLAETQTLLEQATVECAAAKTKTVGVQTNASTSLSSLGRGDDDAFTMDVNYLNALVSMTGNQTRMNSPQQANDKGGGNNDKFLPIGECLGRIRNATECARLVQEHQDEMSRLVSKHEKEQEQLCAKLQQEKDTLLQEAMAEMNAGYKGLRRRLEADHNENMQQATRQHAKELERVRIQTICVTMKPYIVYF